jgi:hypothetical protein
LLGIASLSNSVITPAPSVGTVGTDYTIMYVMKGEKKKKKTIQGILFSLLFVESLPKTNMEIS